MEKRIVTLILCLVSIQAFSQWKSFYPEENKKENNKKVSEKNNLLFNSYMFTALKAKSLEDYGQSLKYFQKCIKLNKSIATPYYESSLINKELGNNNLALEQIQKAIELEGSNRWFVIAHAEILLLSQDHLV